MADAHTPTTGEHHRKCRELKGRRIRREAGAVDAAFPLHPVGAVLRAGSSSGGHHQCSVRLAR